MNDFTADYLNKLPASQLQQLTHYYQVKVTDEMRQAMQASTINDPVLAQFLPQTAELTISEYERHDPIGDGAHQPVPNLVHRYTNRVLWTVTPTCAVYCRFCFRKEMIGRKGRAMSTEARKQALDYIRLHAGIEEVILSGGDPLTLNNANLACLIDALEAIKHVKRIRIHTRIPVVKPERIDDELCATLKGSSKACFMVIHANHAQEFTAHAKRALKAIRAAEVMLFSQSVLLKGINDDADVLAELMNTFLHHQIAPYYLHHLDLAKGTQHFRLTLDEGLQLEAALRQRVAGMAMPRYIVEIPGGVGKVLVNTLTSAQRNQLRQLGID